MKYLFLLFSFLASLYCHSQNTIIYSYDAAGNQTQRELICLTCRNQEVVKEVSELTPDDLLQSSSSDQIKYYPNPVLEQLYVKWENKDSLVTSIDVYSISGQKITSQSNLNTTDNTSLDFKALSNGMYTVILNYDNGETKDLKVIKK